jgi:aspartyl-tRNA(Asn)/glutamyl-tRNA(Gln) amidotransferase subunit A
VSAEITRASFLRGAAASGLALTAAAAPARAAARSGTATPDRPLYDLEISEAADLIHSKRISCVDLAQAVLDRSAAVEARVISYALAYPAEEVLARAHELDRLLRRGQYLGPLHGIPIGIKDIIFTAGKPTEAGSVVYRGFVPTYDATHVALLKQAGVNIVGKAQTIELASGDPAPTNNPWDLKRQPGGSSSGPASGTAAGQFLAGMGSDTRGSIRGPANNCGVTGYRTTFGMVSKYGVFPLSSTIDNVGPLARSALDAAIITEIIAGQDPNDPTTRPVARYDLVSALRSADGSKPLRGVTVGVPASGDYFSGVPSDDELAAFADAVKVIAGLGARIVEVATETLPAPFTTLASMTTPIVNTDVGAFQYRNWQKRAEDFTLPFRRQVNNGNLLPANSFVQAQMARALWKERFLAMFDHVDVFLHANDNIAPLKPPGVDPATPRPSSGSKNSPWSLSGSPSISVPTGLSAKEQMPLGMQVNAAPGDDQVALLVAHAFQQVTAHHRLRPAL